MKRSGRIVVVMLALLAGFAYFSLWANRLPDQLPTGHQHDYQLNPPGLADLEPGDIDPGVPVLCYHYFRAGFDPGYLLRVAGSVFFGMPALRAKEFWTTPVGEFERHLRYFRDTDTRVMTLDEVADLNDANLPLPDRAVIITIDDADHSAYELAFPLLRKYEMKAHLFVPTAMVGARWAGLAICDWDEIREMSESGHILVGSHTRHLHFKIPTQGRPEPVFLHPDLVPADVREDNRKRLASADDMGLGLPNPNDVERALHGPLGPVAEDLLASRLDIRANIGRDPVWLCWPYGFAESPLDSLAGRLGYRGTVSLRPSTYGAGESTGHVGRFSLTAKTTLERLMKVFPVTP